MDDMADYAVDHAKSAVLTMSTPALLAEVNNNGLALRVMRQHTTVRDVLLVQALAARLLTATVEHARATNDLPEVA